MPDTKGKASGPTRELFFNVGGDCKEDEPYIQPDNPKGSDPIPIALGTAGESGFVVGGRSPNRGRAIIPAENTGGADVFYQDETKSFRIILPPVDQEFQAEAGEPPQLPPEYGGDADQVALHYAWPPPIELLPPINTQGRYTFAAGARLRWRGITAFRILEFVAHGREPEAVAYLDWCAQHRVSPRVLVMAYHLFHLSPADGVAALPRLLELATRAGVYVELTALADTKSFPDADHAAIVAAVGEAAAMSGAARVELANEILPLHSTQDDRLGNLDYMAALGRRVPADVPLSLGSNHNGADEDPAIAIATQPFANGFITDHMDRSDAENGWKWVRHTNELGWLADNQHLDAINDEPRRDDLTPGKHLALAVLCHAIRDIGDTFHYGGGLQGAIPTGAELDAFLGREQGWNLVEAETWFRHGTYKNAGHDGSPVKSFENANRVYSTVQGDHAITLALDAADAVIHWNDGWAPTLLADRDGAKVYRVVNAVPQTTE